MGPSKSIRIRTGGTLENLGRGLKKRRQKGKTLGEEGEWLGRTDDWRPGLGLLHDTGQESGIGEEVTRRGDSSWG